MLLYAFLIAGNGQVLVSPRPPSGSDIVVQVDSAYIAHLVETKLQAAGMPGEIKNVQAQLASGDEMTITGDDEFGLLGISVTRHFSIDFQPLVSSCQLQLHVLHADFNGIPITGTAALFEQQINQHVQLDFSGLPKGFTYCTVGVRTTPDGFFVTYLAKPVQAQKLSGVVRHPAARAPNRAMQFKSA
ncbi:MAG: hypothetical protein M3Z24_06345, partial [Chloroflexota bacterium]|nr:hypothetical protein [Chloroflexota bacterium]